MAAKGREAHARKKTNRSQFRLAYKTGAVIRPEKGAVQPGRDFRNYGAPQATVTLGRPLKIVKTDKGGNNDSPILIPTTSTSTTRPVSTKGVPKTMSRSVAEGSRSNKKMNIPYSVSPSASATPKRGRGRPRKQNDSPSPNKRRRLTRSMTKNEWNKNASRDALVATHPRRKIATRVDRTFLPSSHTYFLRPRKPATHSRYNSQGLGNVAGPSTVPNYMMYNSPSPSGPTKAVPTYRKLRIKARSHHHVVDPVNEEKIEKLMKFTQLSIELQGLKSEIIASMRALTAFYS